MENTKEFKKEIGVQWVKAESGTSYLCPVNSFKRMEKPKEADLKKICLDESQNPQND